MTTPELRHGESAAGAGTAPTRKPVIEGLFAETAEGPRLLGSRCATCKTAYFPRTAACHDPRCSKSQVEDAAFGPRGTLWSFAIQHYPPPPPVRWDEPYVPYAIGVVDMPEGLRVLARLATTSLEQIRVGMPVELVLERLCTEKDGSEVTTWKFRPTAASK